MTLSMQNYQTIALAVLGLITLVQWVRLRRLAARLEQVTNGLLQLVDESETATNALRQSVASLSQRGPVTSTTSSRATGSPNIDALGESWNLDRRHRVLTLARHGLSASEIARRLCLPDGEVELLLSFSQGVA